MLVTEYIPKNKFNLWLGLFKTTSGRFSSNPYDCFDSICVKYTFINSEDYRSMSEDWRRLNMIIIEPKRGFWKKLKNKVLG